MSNILNVARHIDGFAASGTAAAFLQAKKQQALKTLQEVEREAIQAAKYSLIADYQNTTRAASDFKKSLYENEKNIDKARGKVFSKNLEDLSNPRMTPGEIYDEVKRIPPEELDIESVLSDSDKERFLTLKRRSQDALWKLWNAMRQVFVDNDFYVEKAPADLVVFLGKPPEPSPGHMFEAEKRQIADAIRKRGEKANNEANEFIKNYVRGLFEEATR